MPVEHEGTESDGRMFAVGAQAGRPIAVFRVFHRFPQDLRRSLHLQVPCGNRVAFDL